MSILWRNVASILCVLAALYRFGQDPHAALGILVIGIYFGISAQIKELEK